MRIYGACKKEAGSKYLTLTCSHFCNPVKNWLVRRGRQQVRSLKEDGMPSAEGSLLRLLARDG